MSEQQSNTTKSISHLIAQKSYAAIKAAIGIVAIGETPSPRKWWRHVLAALLIVAITSAIRAIFFADLGRGIPYLIYFPAVTLAALYGGFLSGFLATVVSAWLCFYWIQQGNLSNVESITLMVFVVSNLLISGIVESMHRAWRRTAQADKSVREGQDQFRSLVEQSIAGIYILQDGKFVYVNPRFAEIFGYGSDDEFIGRDYWFVVAEKDRSMVADNNIGKRIKGEVFPSNYQFSGLRKDGSTVKIGIHGASATHNGRPAIIGLAQDITAKVRDEDEIARYGEQLRTAFMSTVEVVSILSEMRDPYTTGHESRVARLAVAIGAKLGMDSNRQEGLRVAASMHDVGKITIPAEILSKPGKLTPIEYQMIKGHAQAGYDVLKGVKFPWPVAEVALQHHERMDGSGYPQGLKGEAILLEARIIAVADVVEAMSSHRPYRAGLGIDKALAEIEGGTGTAYDPDVVNACLKVIRQDNFAFHSV